MEVYDFFIFERSGKLLFRHLFSSRQGQEREESERGKLVYGLLFSFKLLIPSLSRSDHITEEGIRSFSTSTYTLHSFETPSGYRFCLLTSLSSLSQQLEVRQLMENKLFNELFVDVMKDPTYTPKTTIQSPDFESQIVLLLSALNRKTTSTTSTVL